MTKLPRRPLVVAAILENEDGAVLIARVPSTNGGTPFWQFPRGSVQADESAESAVRRLTWSDMEIQVEIVTGQPPIVVTVDGIETELRYFFCDVIDGSPRTGMYSEFRWVAKAQLCEYDFDVHSTPVAHWLESE